MNREMGQSCPSPSLQCPWQPKPETVQSLLLLAVIASRGARRSSMPLVMMGGRSCEAPLAPFRVGAPCHRGPRDAMYGPDVYLLTMSVPTVGTPSSPDGGSTGSLAHPFPSSTAPASRPPLRTPWFVSTWQSGACLPTVQREPPGVEASIFPEAWAGGREQSRTAGTRVLGMGTRAWGRRGAYVSLLLPRGAAKGAELDTCG